MKIGPYELLHQLNRGGMAIVWLARRVWADGTVKIVVIKIPRKTVMVDPRQIKMFLDETKLAMQLDHGNIVTVFDAGIHEGLPWIAMRFVSGRNLMQLINAVAEQGHEIEFEVAAHIVLQLAYALQYAHEFKIGGEHQHIVHRDVAAKNVMISGAGDVLLTDFGVSAAATVEASGVHVKGTFRYMAPEHIKGNATPLSDAFGMGTVLWSLIEGRDFRWDVEQAAIVSAAMEGYVPPLTREGVPPRLHEVVHGLLAVKEEDRMCIADAIEILETFKPQRTACKRMLSRYFGTDVMRTGRTQVGFQSSEELEEALRIVGITGGAAMLDQVETPPRAQPTESEVRQVSPTIDVSVPAAVRALRAAAEAEAPEPAAPPRPPPQAIPPTERLAASDEPVAERPKPRGKERPPSGPLPDADSRPVDGPRPTSDRHQVSVRSTTGERLVPSAGALAVPARRSPIAVAMAATAIVLGIAMVVGIAGLLLRDESPATVAQGEAPTSPVPTSERPTEPLPVAQPDPEPEPEPLVIRDDEPTEPPAAATTEASRPEPSSEGTQPEPTAEPEPEAEPELEPKPAPTSVPAPSKPAAKESPKKAVPKVELRIVIGFIDAVQIRIAGRTYDLTRAKDELDIKIPSGRQTVRWRMTPSDPWEARTFDFTPGEHHFMRLENDGPRSTAKKVGEG